MAERGIVRVKDSEKVVLLEDGDVPEAEKSPASIWSKAFDSRPLL